MKTKNFSLAMIAFTFAVGGAFASMFVDVSVYVWAKPTILASPTCIFTPATCDNQFSTNICQLKIYVDNSSVSPQFVSSTGTLKTFEAGCTKILYDHANRGLQTIDMRGSIYEVVVKPGF